MDKINKLKIGFLSTISGEWFSLHRDRIEMSKTIDDADFIIFESNGDPVPLINTVKKNYPKDKLVFILSGDQSAHIDDDCIWFSNAVRPGGLAKKQYQIFVTNPAIFKFYNNLVINNPMPENSIMYPDNILLGRSRNIDIYFKGTIWDGMRTNMYNFFKNLNTNTNKEDTKSRNCQIIQNNNYWGWRFSNNKPTQEEIENTAFQSYNDILNSKLCLCPKGNGNSSMRIIEAIACGSIPILINDFSAPFGVGWDEIGLVFDTRIHTWKEIYNGCCELLDNEEKYKNMQKKGFEYFKNVVYSDARMNKLKMYRDINTVCFGFSNIIVDKLFEIHNNK